MLVDFDLWELRVIEKQMSKDVEIASLAWDARILNERQQATWFRWKDEMMQVIAKITDILGQADD